MNKYLVGLLVVLLAAVAVADTPGLFIVSACTNITSPTAGTAWCFDSTNNLVKRWNGSAWVDITTNLLGKLVLYNNAAPTDGQFLIGGTAAGNFTAGTLGAGTNIAVTNGNNTVSVATVNNPTFSTSVTTPTVAMTTVTHFANLGTPANGTMVFCDDCDPPTLVDSTCTSSGAKTGSLAFRVNGQWKCVS